MIDDQHLHTCPFKQGGVAQLLCADACGYNRCTGRGDKPAPAPPKTLRELLRARDLHILKYRLPMTVPWPPGTPPMTWPQEET